jgi:hypothetical protein
MANEDFGTSGVDLPVAPEFRKIVRARLILLCVETEHCALVLPQLLTIVSKHGATAFTVHIRQDDRIHRIEIEMATLTEREATLLLQALRRLRNVRQARFDSSPYDTALHVSAKI